MNSITQGGVGTRLPQQIEHVAIDALIPYARNARTHSDAQVAQLAASMREFGWTNPVLIDEAGGIIAGHGRVRAAQALGMASVPCIRLDGFTEAQKRALVLADNKLAENAGWDEALLAEELQALLTMGFDPLLTGFGDDEIQELLRPDPTGNEDNVPEPPKVPVSRAGDLWLLSKHRLLCGDSTKAEDVARLMGASKADLCFTSPPYAKQRDYDGTLGDWDALMQGVFGALPMADGAQVLVNLGLVHRDCEWWPYWDPWIEWMRAHGWRRFGWYCWDQGPGLPGDWNGRLAPAFEFVFHFNRQAERARKTKKSKFAGVISNGGLRNADGTIEGRSAGPSAIQPRKIPDSVLRIMRHKGGLGESGTHPAIFPVALAEEIIAAFSDPGDVCYEPFAGSGTTIIAAEMTSRICYAMEISPQYTDVAVRRWQEYTGGTATLEGDGRAFDEIVEARRPK